jgi:radical SAM superfamily enzyme YgiQ (UPF0313 family)
VKVVLISTYELGRQPFGLASPAAWLRRAGHEVVCVDLSVGTLPALEVREAGLAGLYVPMHTATRLMSGVIPKLRQLNPRIHLCAFGLYAPLNAEFLRGLGVETVIGGEYEAELVAAVGRVTVGERAAEAPLVTLNRLQFVKPDRTALPRLERYSRLHVNGSTRVVGTTEASRGCKHLCRHCPVTPVYRGSFRIVQPEVVVEDIRQQADAGAEHITFADPDFFNGPVHAVRIVESLHREFPRLSYDVTVKVEHLRKHRELLPLLRDTGCVFVTTAVESIDDGILRKLDKGHTRADFLAVVDDFERVGLSLTPTFIPFTPWTTLEGYRELLDLLASRGLVDHVAPIQLALRLLIPSGSLLLELEDIRKVTGEFDPAALIYRWKHPDPAVDTLASAVLSTVNEAQRSKEPRRETFRRIRELANERPVPDNFDLLPRTVIPYMDEPWFC